MRITKSAPGLPAVQRGQQINLQVNGRSIVAFEGESVAAVLLAEGIRIFRHTPQTRQPRGLFCGMGACYDCLVTVDGVPEVRACMTPVADGMIIETGSPDEPTSKGRP
jgi:sarcosine oxidase subunit alpha